MTEGGENSFKQFDKVEIGENSFKQFDKVSFLRWRKEERIVSNNSTKSKSPLCWNRWVGGWKLWTARVDDVVPTLLVFLNCESPQIQHWVWMRSSIKFKNHISSRSILAEEKLCIGSKKVQFFGQQWKLRLHSFNAGMAMKAYSCTCYRKKMIR